MELDSPLPSSDCPLNYSWLNPFHLQSLQLPLLLHVHRRILLQRSSILCPALVSRVSSSSSFVFSSSLKLVLCLQQSFVLYLCPLIFEVSEASNTRLSQILRRFEYHISDLIIYQIFSKCLMMACDAKIKRVMKIYIL